MTEASNPDGPQRMDGNEMAQSDFNVLFRNDSPLWTSDCPIRFVTVQVSGSPTGTTRYLQTRVQNISGEVVDRIVYKVTSAPSREKMTFKDTQLSLSPGESRALTPRELTSSIDNEVVVSATSVQGDGLPWEATASPIKLPTLQPLVLSADEDAVRMSALKARGLSPNVSPNGKVEDHGSWWVCSCGQLNVRRDYCLNCHIAKADYLRLEDNAELDDLLKQDQEKQAADQERSQKTKRRGLIAVIVISIVVAVIAAIIGIYTAFVIPEMEKQEQYDKAMSYLEAENYDSASTAFNQLGDYKDSKDQLAKAQELKAEQDHQEILDKFEDELNSKQNPIYRYVKIQQLAETYKAEAPEQVEAYVEQAKAALPEYPYMNFADLNSLGRTDAMEFLEGYGHFVEGPMSHDVLIVDGDQLPDGITIWRDSKGQAKIDYDMQGDLYVSFMASIPMSYQDAMNILVPLFGLGEIEETQDITDTSGNVTGFQANGSKFADGNVDDWTVTITDNISDPAQRNDDNGGDTFIRVDL